jgi:hypothetical protein
MFQKDCAFSDQYVSYNFYNDLNLIIPALSEDSLYSVAYICYITDVPYIKYIYIYIYIYYSNWGNDITLMQYLLYFVRIIGPYHLLISTFSSYASLYSLCPNVCNCLSVILPGVMEPTVWLLADAQSHVEESRVLLRTDHTQACLIKPLTPERAHSRSCRWSRQSV